MAQMRGHAVRCRRDIGQSRAALTRNRPDLRRCRPKVRRYRPRLGATSADTGQIWQGLGQVCCYIYLSLPMAERGIKQIWRRKESRTLQKASGRAESEDQASAESTSTLLAYGSPAQRRARSRCCGRRTGCRRRHLESASISPQCPAIALAPCLPACVAPHICALQPCVVLAKWPVVAMRPVVQRWWRPGTLGTNVGAPRLRKNMTAHLHSNTRNA